MWRVVIFVALAMGLYLPASIAAAPMAQTLPESAIPQSALGSEWKIDRVNGPQGPYALYDIHLLRTAQDISAILIIGQARDADEAQALVELQKAELQQRGWDMQPVAGPGDGAAYRSISKTMATTIDPALTGSSDVQVTLVRYVGRTGPYFTEVLTFGLDTPEQTLYTLNARLFTLQIDRFRALTPAPQPTAVPAPTPAPVATAILQPLDARALALAPADVGANWALTLTTGDARSFTVEYFNNTVEYTGFGLDQLTIEPLSTSAAADARVAWWQSSWEDQHVAVRAQDGLGDGKAVRGSGSQDAGLTTVSYAFRVGPVAVVSRAEAATPRGEANIESEALRVAQLEIDRLRQVLSTGNVPQSLAPVTRSSSLDPARITLPAESIGEGSSTLQVQDRGSAEQDPWARSAVYNNESAYTAPRMLAVWALVAPDAARARLGAGMSLAGGVAAGFSYQPVAGLGDETAYMGVLNAADGQTTVEYLYRVGSVMIRLAVRGSDTSVDELTQQGWDLAVAQQQRVLDEMGTISIALEAGQ